MQNAVMMGNWFWSQNPRFHISSYVISEYDNSGETAVQRQRKQVIEEVRPKEDKSV